MIKLVDILEKLDSVGQEDADINNDGKTNKTDKYLSARRKAIAKNLKEEVSIDIAEDTSYEDFAIAVANILKKDYGTRLFKPFIETSVSELKKNE